MPQKTLMLHVPDMCCPVEEREVRQALASFTDISDIRFDFTQRTVCLSYSIANAADIVASIAALGMKVNNLNTITRRCILSIPAMDCPVEVREIENAIKPLALETYRFNVMNRTLTLSANNETIEKVLTVITDLNYEIKEISTKKQNSAPVISIPWSRYGIALLFAITSEAIELLHEYEIISWGVSAEILSFIMALVAIGLVGLGTFKKGLISIKNLSLNMNTLMAVAVIGGILIGAWPEAAMVMVLFEISEAIEQLSMLRARKSIRNLMSVAPEVANVKNAKGQFVERAVELIEPGEVVRVSPGERIALDGTVLVGETSIDQSMVTGESMPAEKAPGDTVWSGSVNLNATIDVLVTAPLSQSLTSRIIEAVENAQASKSEVQRFVDKFAAVYTPIVFVIAVLIALIGPLMTGGDWLSWLYKALVLLVIACPCALVISTPVTIVSALATATRCGLLIKGGLYLEQARKLRHVALDKTGTLTKGEPRVESVFVSAGIDEKLAGSLAASLAAMNNHPLSEAIVAWAKASSLPLFDVKRFSALPGSGVKGYIREGELYLVNLKYLENKGLANEEIRQILGDYAAQGMSTVTLADAFGVQMIFALADTVKEDALQGLKQLKSVGLVPVLLTGDNEQAAHSLAKTLGLDNVQANLLPEDKLAAIEKLQQTGLTAMVGDGINDAPALAKADIGLAMGIRGTDSAIEAANVAIMDDKISSIATLVRLSRMTHEVLIQNIVFAIGIKVIFALLAMTGWATMWMAVFADTGTCLLVVANGMRMLKMKPRLEKMAQNIDKEARHPQGCPCCQ